jgi:zinc protease
MKRLSLLAAILPLAACVPPVSVPAPGAAPSVRLDFVSETLPNGLIVIYHVDRATPIVAVNTWYNVGSKHEQPGRTGLAHLFEHVMLTQNSRNIRAGERIALLEAAGGRIGSEINGSTSFDRTNYFAQVPSNQLELPLWIEADYMATVDEALVQATFDAQREVVRNERRETIDNQPYGSWVEKMVGHAYPVGHPYHHHIIGSMEDLAAATLDDVQNFFRMYYSPDNAVVAVAGDIDLAEARAMVRKHFGDIPRGLPRPPLRSTAVPPLFGEPTREVVSDANARVPRVLVAYRVQPARAPNSAVVPLLAAILGSGRTSHLNTRLVREQQIATSASAFNFEMVDGADILVSSVLGRPGSDPDSLEQALNAALADAVAAITPEQLSRVKATVRYDFVNQLQDMGGLGGRADRLAEGQTFYGDPGWVNRRVRELEAVTLEDLRALAATSIRPTNSVTLVYVPAPQAAPPGEGTN